MEGYFNKVYKYEKFEICKLILRNQTLRFSKPTVFKDLFDSTEEIIEITEDYVIEAANRKYENVPILIKFQKISEALKNYKDKKNHLKQIFFQDEN
jgi:hypothetical protein